MIQMRSWLTVADNSGARRLTCILPLGGDVGSRAGLGDIITASVKEATPESPIKKGKVVRAVVVRTRKEHRRRDGSYIRFDDNAAVLISMTRTSLLGLAYLVPLRANCGKKNSLRSSLWHRKFGSTGVCRALRDTGRKRT
jgi:large subunit ribosomal protein L14